MSQMILTTSNMQTARANCAEELRRLDRILFPSGERSLLDPHMSADEAEEAVKRFLEALFHQGTITGNLEKFLDAIGMGAALLDDSETIRRNISVIASHESELRLAIEKAYEDVGKQHGRIIGGLPFSILISAVSFVGFMMSTSSRALAAAKEAIPSGNDPSKSGSGLIVAVLAFLIACGVIARQALKNKNGEKEENHVRKQTTQTAKANHVISKKEALDVLDLLVAIAAIYRVCEHAGQ